MRLPLSTRTKFVGLLFVLPSLLFLFAFFVYPILRSVYISFFDYSVGRDLIPAGWSNYGAILTDPGFWHSGYITLRYAVSALVLELLGGLIFALTYSRLKATRYLRGILIIPLVIPIPIFAAIWQYIYNPQYGLLNGFLQSLGFTGQPIYLTDPDRSLISIVVAQTTWVVFVVMFLLIAGMQSIRNEYYEAARIDGAGPTQQFFKITLPLLKPTLTFIVIFRMMDLMQAFTTIYLMMSTATGTAVTRDTRVWSIMIYREAFMRFQLGSAASMSLIVFMFILVLIVLYLWASKTYESSLE